jgi:hypothetical protein
LSKQDRLRQSRRYLNPGNDNPLRNLSREQEAKMDHRDILGGSVSPDALRAGHEICPVRRGLLVAPLLAALSVAVSDQAALAGTINPSETQITLPGAIRWGNWVAGFPPHSGEMATLYGGLDKPGPAVLFELVDRAKPAWRKI